MRLLFVALALFVLSVDASAAAVKADSSSAAVEADSSSAAMSAVLARLDRLEIELKAERALRVSAQPLMGISVLEYGAKGDNSTDNTKPFQTALDFAYTTTDFVKKVIVPSGLYLFKGNLTIPPGVTLQGSFDVVPSHDLRSNQPLTDGSILMPTQGKGVPCDINCTRAFVTVTENAVLRGFSIYYPEQENKKTPVAYPWTVFCGDPDKKYNRGGSADNAAVTDVELLGSWNGVAAVQAHRHYIARVHGHPINIGVFVDATYDIGRIEDVHFNPWFSSAHPFVYYQSTYGRAFVFGRSDWEYVFNTFAFGYAIGYHFIERETGSMNGNFLGIGADLMTNASVQVDQSQPFGILITNGEFTAFCDGGGNGFCDPSVNRSPTHVVVGPKNQGTIWPRASGAALSSASAFLHAFVSFPLPYPYALLLPPQELSSSSIVLSGVLLLPSPPPMALAQSLSRR
jgi:hypothetical protein